MQKRSHNIKCQSRKIKPANLNKQTGSFTLVLVISSFFFLASVPASCFLNCPLKELYPSAATLVADGDLLPLDENRHLCGAVFPLDLPQSGPIPGDINLPVIQPFFL